MVEDFLRHSHQLEIDFNTYYFLKKAALGSAALDTYSLLLFVTTAIIMACKRNELWRYPKLADSTEE